VVQQLPCGDVLACMSLAFLVSSSAPLPEAIKDATYTTPHHTTPRRKSTAQQLHSTWRNRIARACPSPVPRQGPPPPWTPCGAPAQLRHTHKQTNTQTQSIGASQQARP
jgi:hypothetical protein